LSIRLNQVWLRSGRSDAAMRVSRAMLSPASLERWRYRRGPRALRCGRERH
jgi:hypothetical protein